MWLSSMGYPDHNTINRFRGVRLKHAPRSVFEDVAKPLAEEGLPSIGEVNTDGTKIEANANKHTFVWKKSIGTNKEKMAKQLAGIWHYAQQVASDEDKMPDPPDFTSTDSSKVKATVDQLNEKLAGKDNIDKKIKDKFKDVTKHYPVNIIKYEQQEAILKERDSYSKTDQGATFMRMKEGHMKNVQLKPGYNVQVSTLNQFVVNYTIHSNPTDTNTLKAHLAQHGASFGKPPVVLVADAGYGPEENYALPEQKGTVAFVKYGMFDKQQNNHYNSKHTFAADKLFYERGKDCYICPMGQQMNFIGTSTRKTSTGFEQSIRRYQAINCANLKSPSFIGFDR